MTIPTRGITYARNKSLASVSENTSFVAFIDDDEVPAPQWLDELLWVQQTYNADVVGGPVTPYFVEKNVPQWVLDGKFFERNRQSTGDNIEIAFTHNSLVRADIFKQFTPVFQDRFAFTGGEDVHLFMGLHHQGYKMVWADDALVTEWIPKSRTNMQWILRRGYRTWGSHSLCEQEYQPSVKIQALRVVKGSLLIMYGLLLLLPSLALKRHLFVKALLQIARGAGTFSGLLGRHYEEYKVINSSGDDKNPDDADVTPSTLTLES
ncbi:MAG: glycosyltransferase [Nostocaceae cyanobacterium]|nr:glycosyltransferase [Nostocaceae cyanobacterium]